MSDYRALVVRFGNRGMVTKLTEEQLRTYQYAYLLNMESVQEGQIETRSGYRCISIGSSLSWIHTLGRVATGADPTENYRYLGDGNDIYRINSTDSPGAPTRVTPAGLGNNFGKKWSMLSYRKFTSGQPYGYFATRSLLRICSSGARIDRQFRLMPRSIQRNRRAAT